MKKVMFVAAVAAGLVAFGEGIESHNTVGYATQSAGSNAYPTLGAMFVTPGTTSFKLSNITAKNASYREDVIQYLDPALAKIDPNKVYTWYEDDEAPEDNGWYFYAPGTDNDEEYAGDEEFPAGTAFLGNFNPANGVELVYAGEVMMGDITIDTKDASGNYLPYMYIVNPLPKTMVGTTMLRVRTMMKSMLVTNGLKSAAASSATLMSRTRSSLFLLAYSKP